MTEDRRASQWTFSEAQLALFPELRHVVEGQAPLEAAEPFLRAQGGRATVLLIAFSVATTPPLVLLLHRRLGVDLLLTLAIVIPALMGLSWVLLGLVAPMRRRPRIRAELRARLREAGLDPCPTCAHDRRGTSGSCPECGTARGGAG